MVDYGKILIKSLKFSINPKRWLPLFILDTVFFTAALLLVLSNISAILPVLALPAAGTAVSLMIYFALGIAVWGLLRLWIAGALIHQSWKEKEFRQSWKISLNRYITLLVVTIIVAGIGFAVSMVPAIGVIFAIVASIVFFFSLQPVFIDKFGIIKSIERSYFLFRTKTLKVFLIWLITSLVASAITVVFTIPLLAVMISGMIAFSGLGGVAALFGLVFWAATNSALLFALGVIYIFGISIASVFSLKASTEFYLAVKPGIIGRLKEK